MTAAAFVQLQRFFYVLGSLVLVVLTLFFARSVLLPLVAAVLLTFILSPLVTKLQSKGCARIVAVVLVVGLVVVLFALVFAMIIGEFNNLADEAPRYKARVEEKLATLRGVGDGFLPKDLVDVFNDFAKDMLQAPLAIVGSMLEIVVNAGLVLLLVIFMLHQREELRNRLVRLIGTGNLSGTIKTIEDASQRISRFLEMQLIINLVFGTTLGVCLFFVGVPYALLWGFLGTLLRYIPYLGPWLAALVPLILAWAIFPSWVQFFVVLGLFIALELTLSNFIEPWLYGRSVGVSEVALLLFAVFWAWLWGPLGLILATPLTAVLVVFGRHFPQLEFFTLLLSDQPALDPPLAFYYRLLANDQDEATDIVEAYVLDNGLEAVYADIFIYSLTQIEREREQGKVSADEQKRFLEMSREILMDAVFPLQQARWSEQATEDKTATAKISLFGVPSRSEDELVLTMFKECLDPRKFSMTIPTDDMLFAEMLTKINQENPAFIVIGCLPSPRSARSRFLCKKIRSECPDQKIFVGCWGWQTLSDQIIERFKNAGADYVGLTFADIAHQLEVHHPIAMAATDKEPAALISAPAARVAVGTGQPAAR